MRSSAECFFRKTLNSLHNQTPRVINVDKNAVSPGKEGGFPSVENCEPEELIPKLCKFSKLKKFYPNTVGYTCRYPNTVGSNAMVRLRH